MSKKRGWKSPLGLMIIWCLIAYFATRNESGYLLEFLDAFIAGTYFEEFLNAIF